MSGATTREQIVEEADRLFHERGFGHASFADIAAAVGISRGNFYYHFKTKDEILDAVIARRRANVQRMLERWESEGASPADRIRRFIGVLVTNQTAIMRHGCPIGTLCGELAKLDHPAQVAASGLFILFRDWLTRQFVDLGHAEEAEALAMSLLARSQGVAVLANAFHDDAFVEREVADLCAWLDAQRVEHASAC